MRARGPSGPWRGWRSGARGPHLVALALCGALLGPVAGCGCADDPDHWEPGRPRIDRLRFLQQSPADPLALEWSITFTDSDGDVSQGALLLYIDDQEAGSQPLTSVFQSQSPPLAPTATEGELEVVVKLREALPAGQQVKIGFVLEEGSGDCARSNEPHVVLQALMPGST